MNFNAKSLNSPVKKLQLLLNKKGSSLIIVLVSFAVLMIMGAALVIVVSYNHKNATDYHKKQQAQYTARGVMESLVSAFSNPAIGGTVVAKIPDSPSTLDGSGDLTADNMGSYKVMLNYTDGSKKKIKADVIATYQGMSYKLTAYFKQGKGDRLNPLDFVLFCKDGTVNMKGNSSDTTTINGKFYELGSVNYKNIIFKDKVLFTGSANAENCIFEKDVITPAKLSDVSGNTFNGEQWYPGAIGSDGLPITEAALGFNANVQNHQRKWSSINYEILSASAIKIGGIEYDIASLTAKMPTGELLSFHQTPPPDATYGTGDGEIRLVGKVFTFKNGDKMDINSKLYTAINGETLNFSDINAIKTNSPSAFGPPNVAAFAGQSLTVSPITYGNDGMYRLTSSSTTQELTIDTSGGDIHLYATANISINHDVKIMGDNNVYIHLMGNNIKISDGVFMGDTGSREEHQLFVEGDGAGLTFEIVGKARFKGAAYLGSGSYKETGAECKVTGNKIEGSITATTIEITRGNTYKYTDYFKEPVFNGTIINNDDPTTPYFIYPQNTTGEKDWVLEGYKK